MGFYLFTIFIYIYTLNFVSMHLEETVSLTFWILNSVSSIQRFVFYVWHHYITTLCFFSLNKSISTTKLCINYKQTIIQWKLQPYIYTYWMQYVHIYTYIYICLYIWKCTKQPFLKSCIHLVYIHIHVWADLYIYIYI
jgi:hypothetical protein